jgi:hypothetical protein
MSSPAVRRSPVALALLAAITLLLSLLSTVPAAHADVDYFDTAASASYSDFSSPTGAVVTVSSATHVWVEMSITPAQWASWDAQDPNGEASLVLINDTTGQLETVFVGGCGQGGGGGLKFGIRSPLDTTDTQCVFGFRPGAFTGTTHFVLRSSPAHQPRATTISLRIESQEEVQSTRTGRLPSSTSGRSISLIKA